MLFSLTSDKYPTGNETLHFHLSRQCNATPMQQNRCEWRDQETGKSSLKTHTFVYRWKTLFVKHSQDVRFVEGTDMSMCSPSSNDQLSVVKSPLFYVVDIERVFLVFLNLPAEALNFVGFNHFLILHSQLKPACLPSCANNNYNTVRDFTSFLSSHFSGSISRAMLCYGFHLSSLKGRPLQTKAILDRMNWKPGKFSFSVSIKTVRFARNPIL